MAAPDKRLTSYATERSRTVYIRRPKWQSFRYFTWLITYEPHLLLCQSRKQMDITCHSSWHFDIRLFDIRSPRFAVYASTSRQLAKLASSRDLHLQAATWMGWTICFEMIVLLVRTMITTGAVTSHMGQHQRRTQPHLQYPLTSPAANIPVFYHPLAPLIC